MNKQEAEAAIVELVELVDEIRATRTPSEAAVEIAKVETQIAELKKITGPRRHVGVMRA